MSKTIYIVISQTGTALSRILKFITGAKYNHASISLESDLSTMYSFGRTNPYNPVHGGFVTESPHYGTFKRFSGTKVEVLSISVSEGQYINLKQMLEGMVKNKKRYHYNYLGLFLAGAKIHYRQANSYYCSEYHCKCELYKSRRKIRTAYVVIEIDQAIKVHFKYSP